MPSVAERERTGNLCEHFPDEVFTDVFLRRDTLLDDFRQIPALTVLHNDVDSEIPLVDAPVIVADDVGVVEVSQDVDLRDDLLLLFLTHLAIVQLLPDQNPAVTDAFDLAHVAERAYTK